MPTSTMNRTELQQLVLKHMTKEQVSSEFGDRRLKATWQAAYDYILASLGNQNNQDTTTQHRSLLKTATAIVKDECQRAEYNVLRVVLQPCFVVWFQSYTHANIVRFLCYLFYRSVPIVQQTRTTLTKVITSRFTPTVIEHRLKVVSLETGY